MVAAKCKQGRRRGGWRRLWEDEREGGKKEKGSIGSGRGHGIRKGGERRGEDRGDNGKDMHSLDTPSFKGRKRGKEKKKKRRNLKGEKNKISDSGIESID